MAATQKSSQWGGRRPNAGRKKVSNQVSARVPMEVIDLLKSSAAAAGLSLSAQTAEVLKEWAKSHKK